MAETSYKNGVLTHSPALFWVPAELLKCNSNAQTCIFTEALKGINFFLEKPVLFETLSPEREKDTYNPQSYVQSVFMKYHSPWHENIPAFASYIMNSTCNNLDIDLATRTLGLLIQCNFHDFFSTSKTRYYTAALALLPWMWIVATNDYGRAIYVSDDVSMLQNTASLLSKRIEDEDVSRALSEIAAFEYNELYNAVHVIATKSGAILSEEEMKSLGNWYANLLKYGDQILKIPIYMIVSWFTEVENINISKLMPELVTIAYSDEIPEYKESVKHLKDSLGAVPETSIVHTKPSFP